MTAECFQAIIVICGIFTVCELIGKKINYKIPTLVLVMIVFIIFGGAGNTQGRTGPISDRLDP